ncbi:MAG: hypothetical protein KAQ94_01415 [Arcobacteraceae bacterium]|nr:hypothetical protein [Arcobacteraceae bacterium]
MDLDIEENIELRVLLLGIYKRADDETLMHVVKTMDNSRVFSLKQGKQYLKGLRSLGYVSDDGLTMIGIEKAKEIELEFKL